MDKDPWIDPDPQPGDFDTEIAHADPGQLETHEGNPDAGAPLLVRPYQQRGGQEAEGAEEQRADEVGDVVRSLADQPA